MESIKYTALEGNKLKIENLTNRDIIYRNFSGKSSQFNRNGEMKFTVVIDSPENAQKIANYGWNVKVRPSKNDDGEMFCTLDVKVRLDLDWVKPKIVQFTRAGRVQVTADNIANFDQAEFEKVDLVLRQYAWKNAKGESGISAQLSEMYVRLAEGVLEAKWAEEECQDGDEEDMPF